MQALKNLYRQEIAHNSIVDKNLKRIHGILDRADSLESLELALQEESPDVALSFKNRFFWWMMLAYLIPGILLCMAAWKITIAYENIWLLSLFLVPLGIFFYLCTFFRSDAPRQQMVARALNVYEQLKYNFRNGAPQQSLAHDDIVKDFAHVFKRGNHSNSLPRYASGRLQNAEQDLEFTIFNYHYVNKRTEVYYEGKTRKTRVVYDHFDRWGGFVSGCQPIGVAITSFKNRVYPTKWDTSSINFNKRHHITGASEIELAKLFQPVNILMIEKMLADHKEFDLQVSNQLPVLYWGVNQDLFQRKVPNLQPTTLGQLRHQLSGLQLPQLEHFLQNLQPLLTKVAQ